MTNRPHRRAAIRLLAGGVLGAVLSRGGIAMTRAAQRLDSDGDGLYDDDKTLIYGTDPFSYDTDGDTVGDGEEVYNGTNPLLGDQVLLEEPPAENGDTIHLGDVNSGGNAGDANGVGDTYGNVPSCRAEGASCTYDGACCNSGPVLCCFDGTTLDTRCTDVTAYGGVCL